MRITRVVPPCIYHHPHHHPIVLLRHKTQGVQQAHPWGKHQSHLDSPDFCIRQKHMQKRKSVCFVISLLCLLFSYLFLYRWDPGLPVCLHIGLVDRLANTQERGKEHQNNPELHSRRGMSAAMYLLSAWKSLLITRAKNAGVQFVR